MFDPQQLLTVDPSADPAVLDEAARVWPEGAWSRSRPRPSTAWGPSRPTPRRSPGSTRPRAGPRFNPLIVHVAGIGQARECVADWPESRGSPRVAVLAGSVDAGPPPIGLIPDIVTAGKATVGVRVPRRHGGPRPDRTGAASRSPPPAPTGRTGFRRPGPSTSWPTSTAGST